MYAASPSIAARVFAVIPEAIGHVTRRSDRADAQINGGAIPIDLKGSGQDAYFTCGPREQPTHLILKEKD